MDGYGRILNRLSAEVKARVEIAAEDDRLREARAAGRLRESESGSDLIDLGPGVPKPWKPMTSAEIMREAALAEAAARLRESNGPDGLVDLGPDVPRPERLREAVYGAPGSPQIYYEDANTYQDVTDLYSVIKNDVTSGSESLENDQAASLMQAMVGGHSLSDVQIGVLRKLMSKYAAQITALRASPDREGQDYLDVPDPATARILSESDRGRQVGLQPSGGQQSDASPGRHPCPRCDKGLLPDGSSCPSCKGSGVAVGKAQPLAESGPLRGLLAPPDVEVLGADGLFDLGPDVPRKPLPAFMSVGAVNPGPSVVKMRSSAPTGEGLSPLRESALAESHLLSRYNKEVANGKPRRLREVRGTRAPRDPENLTMGEVREIMREWEAVAA